MNIPNSSILTTVVAIKHQKEQERKKVEHTLYMVATVLKSLLDAL